MANYFAGAIDEVAVYTNAFRPPKLPHIIPSTPLYLSVQQGQRYNHQLECRHFAAAAGVRSLVERNRIRFAVQRCGDADEPDHVLSREAVRASNPNGRGYMSTISGALTGFTV